MELSVRPRAIRRRGDCLEALGLPVWVDSHSLRGGDKIPSDSAARGPTYIYRNRRSVRPQA